MQEIEIGLSMLHCLRYPFSHMTQQLQRVKVRHVEILDEYYHAFSRRRIKVLKEISQSRGLVLTVHAPFVDVNLASPNPSFRSVVLKRLKRSLRLADELGARLWVFHPGLRTGVSHLNPGEDWELNLRSICDLLDTANKYGANLTIENPPEPFPFILKSVDDFTRFYSALSDVDLGLTLDIGHANVNDQIYDFIENFSDRIVHVHASDNDGTFDSHLGIGEGSVDWMKVSESLRSMKYKGAVVVESERKVEESVRKLKQIFAEIP